MEKERWVQTGWIRLLDFLEFEKGIYFAFIKEGIVDGDVVTYTTNFGVGVDQHWQQPDADGFHRIPQMQIRNKTVEVLMDGLAGQRTPAFSP